MCDFKNLLKTFGMSFEGATGEIACFRGNGCNIRFPNGIATFRELKKAKYCRGFGNPHYVIVEKSGRIFFGGGGLLSRRVAYINQTGEGKTITNCRTELWGRFSRFCPIFLVFRTRETGHGCQLEYQAMPSVAHDGWLCTFTI